MVKKIDIHKNFIRDENTGAVLNKDKGAFMNRKSLKKRLKDDRDEKELLKETVLELKKRLDKLENSTPN